MTTESVPLRHSRMESLMPYQRCRKAHCVVIGCGAVGHQTARLLAAVGVGSLTLFDHDTVGEENLGPQLFSYIDVKRRKADAVSEECYLLYPPGKSAILSHARKFTRRDIDALTPKPGAAVYVFSCADSMHARRDAFEAAKEAGVELFVDARAASEVVRVLAVSRPQDNKADAERYEATLFSDAEAFSGSCTTKMTGYMGAMAAGLQTAQFAKAVRGQPVTPDATLNLFAMELV